MDLLSELKSCYQQAEITILDGQIKIQFEKAKDEVLIKEENNNRYTVSYPKLKKIGHKKQYREDFTTSKSILKEGMFWILNQVQKNGKVLPEFME